MPSELEQQLERALRASRRDAARWGAPGGAGRAAGPAQAAARARAAGARAGDGDPAGLGGHAVRQPGRAAGDRHRHVHAQAPVQARARSGCRCRTGASGIAVLAGGRMWATAHAVSINGAKATAVELSPNALNIAVGRGRDLVAVHTNGSGERVLRRTEGQVVAISWAPNPIEIAYVVKVGGALPAAPDRGRRRQRPADRPVGRARPADVALGQRRAGVRVGERARRRARPGPRPVDRAAARLPAAGPTQLAYAPAGGTLVGRRQRQRRGGQQRAEPVAAANRSRRRGHPGSPPPVRRR